MLPLMLLMFSVSASSAADASGGAVAAAALMCFCCCCIRTQSEIEGLTWGEAHKLVPVAFGVKKLVLSCVVEDDKVMLNSKTTHG